MDRTITADLLNFFIEKLLIINKKILTSIMLKKIALLSVLMPALTNSNSCVTLRLL